MIAAGIWAHPADRRLTVALLRKDGSRPPPLRVARTPQARDGMLLYLLSLGRQLDVVLTESVARQDRLAEPLRDHGLRAWLVADSLLDSIATAAGLGHSAARSRAAILARLPAVATFRPMLRALPQPDPKQLSLVP